MGRRFEPFRAHQEFLRIHERLAQFPLKLPGPDVSLCLPGIAMVSTSARQDFRLAQWRHGRRELSANLAYPVRSRVRKIDGAIPDGETSRKQVGLGRPEAIAVVAKVARSRKGLDHTRAVHDSDP